MILADTQLLQFEVLGATLLSFVLGGLIGYEREAANKPAGLRTHMMVASASTVLVFLGTIVVTQFEQGPIAASLVQTDPIRIIEAIIAGVAFLGAGTIIRRGGDIEGLTTAASILFTAAIGIAVALSQFIIAVGGTVLALITLRLVHSVDARLRRETDILDEKEE